MRLNGRARAGGFTLIELLVTILVVSVGLLGLGKLQAAALAAGQVSALRSLMSFQAEGLAGAMHANPGYWASTAAPLTQFTVTTTGGVATVSVAAGSMASRNTSTDYSCVGLDATHFCTPANIAYDDVHTWANGLAAGFPGSKAAVSCNATAGPASCDITLSWNERQVAINRGTATGAQTVAASTTSQQGNTLVLHVQP